MRSKVTCLTPTGANRLWGFCWVEVAGEPCWNVQLQADLLAPPYVCEVSVKLAVSSSPGVVGVQVKFAVGYWWPAVAKLLPFAQGEEAERLSHTITLQ